MIKYHPKNARIKRDYFEWQKEANRKSDSTIDNIRKAIDRYERYTAFEDFRIFNKHKAIAFKKNLSHTRSKKSGRQLSKATVSSTLSHLKDFFKWLAYQRGYRRIDINQIEYFNLSEKELRVAKGKLFRKYPTIEQIRAVLASMSDDSEIGRRNRALIAFTLLTGMRDGAIASLRLKHARLDQELVEQRADEVNTKFGKTIHTYFFPVGDDIKEIVVDWITYLYKVKLFTDNDPVFPRTRIKHNAKLEFQADGIEPIRWQSANQIRKIFKDVFTSAGLEYFTPHTFRTTLVRFGERVCRTPEDFKAWSQNLGHEQVLTTFTSYGQVEEFKQGEIIKGLSATNARRNDNAAINEKLDILVRKVLEEENSR